MDLQTTTLERKKDLSIYQMMYSCQPTYLYTNLSISIHPSIHQPTKMSIYPSTNYISIITFSTNLSTILSIYQPIYHIVIYWEREDQENNHCGQASRHSEMHGQSSRRSSSRVHPGRWGGATHLGGVTRVAPPTPNFIGLWYSRAYWCRRLRMSILLYTFLCMI